jgi:HD-like signal output (HDOD) protein
MEDVSLDFTISATVPPAPAATLPREGGVAAPPSVAARPAPSGSALEAVSPADASADPDGDVDLSPWQRRLAERLKALELHQMPQVSPVAAKLAALNPSEVSDERAVCGLLKQEPVVVARLVGLANSAAYGVRGRTFNTVEQAVSRLGLEPSVRIAFGITCGKAVNKALSPGWREFLWLHALTVAQAATLIATKVQPSKRAEAQFAGLIYDIGVMTIEGLVPGTLDLLVDTAQARNSTLAQMQTIMLGKAQRAVTPALLKLWSVPEEIANAVAERNPSDMEPDSLPAILYVADALARSHAVLAAIYGDEEPPFPMETIATASVGARVLALCPAIAKMADPLSESVGRAVARQRDAAKEFAAA